MGERWNKIIQWIHQRHCKKYGHEWSTTRCVCLHCGHTAHKWNGCSCTRCGKVQDSGHVWKDGKCSICDRHEIIVCPACSGKGEEYYSPEWLRSKAVDDRIFMTICPTCKGSGYIDKWQEEHSAN